MSAKKEAKKETWAQWDQAWDLGLTPSERLMKLENATASEFVYSNMDTTISGDLEGMVGLIGKYLKQQDYSLVVNHIKWYEQLDQSALQWEMVDKASRKVAICGWSHARYDGCGKLLSVSDFW